jgi:glycosyltransferase involved in cell wall biosynthesis
MAVYNGGRYLGEQLDSLAAQETLPLELIVTDDGSTDGSLAVLRAFAERAPFPVRIYSNPAHLGYSDNFIKAVSLCQGEFIAFCDQDDIWEKKKLSLAQRHLQQSGDIAVSHDFSVFFEQRHPEIPSYYEYLERNSRSPQGAVKGCCLVFRRALLNAIGWPAPETGWKHDNWVCMVASLLGHRGYIRQPLTRYRIHDGNASGYLLRNAPLIIRLFKKVFLPTSTSREDVDVLMAKCFKCQIDTKILERFDRAGIGLPEARRQRIKTAIAAHLAVRAFIASRSYSKLRRRLPATLRLFRSGAYRCGGGLHGALKDLFGRRRRKVYCA